MTNLPEPPSTQPESGGPDTEPNLFVRTMRLLPRLLEGALIGLLATVLIWILLGGLFSAIVDHFVGLIKSQNPALVVFLLLLVVGVMTGAWAAMKRDNREQEKAAADKAAAEKAAAEKIAAEKAIAAGQIPLPPSSPAPASAAPQSETIRDRLGKSARGTIFLVTDTIRIVLPSKVFTSEQTDKAYSNTMKDKFVMLVRSLPGLEENDKKVIEDKWIEQIAWTTDRANRERDANEIFTWWQIFLAALIPFFANLTLPNNNVDGPLVVSILGIIVAVLTGVARFRRSEERWKHYRRLTEDYQRELWSFITLTGDYEKYKSSKNYQVAYRSFSATMTKLNANDINTFFNEPAALTQDDIRRMMKEDIGGSNGEGGGDEIVASGTSTGAAAGHVPIVMVEASGTSSESAEAPASGTDETTPPAGG